MLRTPAPAWIAWFSAIGAIVAIVLGLARRRPPLEMRAALAVAAFLLPVVAGGLLDLRPTPPPPIATLSHGLVDAVRRDVPAGSVVYSDPETSFRLAAFAPVYIAVAPPGHVADTKENRPYVAGEGRAPLLPHDRPLHSRSATAPQYLVVDGLRSEGGSTSPCRCSTGTAASRSIRLQSP